MLISIRGYCISNERKGCALLIAMGVVMCFNINNWRFTHNEPYTSPPQHVLAIPQFGESLSSGWFSPIVNVDFLAYGSEDSYVSLCTPISNHIDLHYLRLPTAGILNTVENSEEPGPILKSVQDYFAYLRLSQEKCRKMLLLGGYLKCPQLTAGIPDGKKVVCLDPTLELPPTRNPQSCLTLSFGIQKDSSFDTSMADMNCEVHMFDLFDYTPVKLLRRSHHVHFHQAGLAEERIQRDYLFKEVTMDTLAGHLANNNLTQRPIHILKMDIESDEWTVMKQIVTEPFMDLVGQISLEIHAQDLLNLPLEIHLEYLQDKYDALRAIEGRGFKKIAYWDNTNSKLYRDVSGVSHYTCGEIHFINTNWYNSTFKTRLKEMGIHFT